MHHSTILCWGHHWMERACGCCVYNNMWWVNLCLVRHSVWVWVWSCDSHVTPVRVGPPVHWFWWWERWTWGCATAGSCPSWSAESRTESGATLTQNVNVNQVKVKQSLILIVRTVTVEPDPIIWKLNIFTMYFLAPIHGIKPTFWPMSSINGINCVQSCNVENVS